MRGGPPAGREVIGFAPSGPSSGYLPASLLETPLDWDKVKGLGSMLGSGAVVVCADNACMLDMALTAVRFYRNEIVREVLALPDRDAEAGGPAGELDARGGGAWRPGDAEGSFAACCG